MLAPRARELISHVVPLSGFGFTVVATNPSGYVITSLRSEMSALLVFRTSIVY